MAYVLAVAGSLLILWLLVWAMQHYTRPEPIGQTRAAERRKNLETLRNAEIFTLSHYGWTDPTKSIVRLPIERAMELMVLEYKDPEGARARFVARAEEAFALPPPPPEVPSEFE
jgi:hypothetical protein